MTNPWATDKLWTCTEVEHAQGPSITNLYPALEESKPYRMEDQKIVHARRSQEWTAECIDEPLDHDKPISSRQALDIHRSGACTRPKHYQLVPSQYKSCGSWVRGKRGYGLAMGRKESLFWGSRSNSFGENVLMEWHITQKRKWWVRTTRCMP